MSQEQVMPGTERRRFRPYPKYKDSGVEWLGTVPASWQICEVKRRFDIYLGKMLQPEPASAHDLKVPYLKAVNVQWEDVDLNSQQTMWASNDEIQSGQVAMGDLLICEGGEVGRAAILTKKPVEPTIIQNSLHRVRSQSETTKFLMYILEVSASGGWLAVECNKATIQHFTRDKLGSLRIALPSLEDQRRILSFVDRETSKIDALIEKKERLIELLKEKRTALITQAVTKGLDPNVPMKDSGVEWLGEIPKHWIGLPLKRLVSVKITDGPHETPEIVTEGVDFISAEAVSNGRIDFNKRRGFIDLDLHKHYCRKCKPVRDDILLCKSGATTGKLAGVDVDSEFSIWSPLALVRPDRSRVIPKFLEIVLRADYVQNQIKRTWSAGTQPNISMGDIDKLYILTPNKEEQLRILVYLDEKTGGFDALISQVLKAIELLKEIRTALISAAVTGKIDVRDSQSPGPSRN